MNRRNLFLTVALVVQVMLILLIVTLRTPSASATAKPLFEPLQAADITQLVIQDHDGKRIELAKQNGEWTLPQSDGFPADAAKVTPFLDKLVGIRTDRLIARTSASHDRLQVAPANFARRVEIKSGNGASRVLLIGSSPTGSAVHIRLDGSDDVYLTDSLTSYDANVEASNWINTSYLTVTQDNLGAVTIANANGTFEFEKGADSAWTMKGLAAGETFDAAKLTDLVTRLSTVNMTRPLGKTIKPEYGLEPPTATVTLVLTQTNTSSKPIELRIGAKDATNSAYTIGSTESPYYVQVSSYTVEEFVTRTRQDFLTLPPTSAVPEVTVAPAP